MRSKKSSLALSMNAIVVIILAMAMLGVGIFIVNKIRSEAGNVIKIEPPPIANPADASDPLVVESSKIKIKLGKNNFFRVSVYNNKAGENMDVELDLESCTPSDLSSSVPLIQGKSLAPRKEATYWATFDAKELDITGEYACTLALYDKNSNSDNPLATEDVIFDLG